MDNINELKQKLEKLQKEMDSIWVFYQAMSDEFIKIKKTLQEVTERNLFK